MIVPGAMSAVVIDPSATFAPVTASSASLTVEIDPSATPEMVPGARSAVVIEPSAGSPPSLQLISS